MERVDFRKKLTRGGLAALSFSSLLFTAACQAKENPEVTPPTVQPITPPQPTPEVQRALMKVRPVCVEESQQNGETIPNHIEVDLLIRYKSILNKTFSITLSESDHVMVIALFQEKGGRVIDEEEVEKRRIPATLAGYINNLFDQNDSIWLQSGKNYDIGLYEGMFSDNNHLFTIGNLIDKEGFSIDCPGVPDNWTPPPKKV